jgi:homoserine kinase
MLNPMIKKITAFAPATCANVIVGFDILGFACDFIGDTVTLILRDDKKIIIEAIDSRDTLPFDIEKNTASVVIKEMVEKLKINAGYTLHIKKGIPMSSGLGGSAASAVAAAVACNGFLKTPLTKKELLPYILCGEAVVSGKIPHYDNIAPCLYGGLILVSSLDPLDIIALPVPEIYCVFVHPHLLVNTKEARKILKPTILLTDHVKQSRELASFLVSLYQKENNLLKRSLIDFIIEPQREHYIPRFHELKKIALEKGALGLSFSGSGPTLVACAEKKEVAKAIGVSIVEQFKKDKIKAEYWVSQMDGKGARVVV